VEGRKFYENFEERTGYELKVPDQETVSWGGEDIEPPIDPEKSYSTLQSLEIPVTRYESDEFGELYLRYELDDVDFTVSDTEAAYTDGTTAANGFAKAAVEQGLQLITGVEVKSVETTAGT